VDNMPRVVDRSRVSGKRGRSDDGRKIVHLTAGGHGRSLDSLVEKASNMSGLGTG
jgi:hypothetical protein